MLMTTKCRICGKNVFNPLDLLGLWSGWDAECKSIKQKFVFDGVEIERVVEKRWYHGKCIQAKGEAQNQ